jgi:demethylmenaquinone methyltransferase / 2-methoxy-6-polyprenyl-1,4-benzoquinol methylase
MKTPNVQSMFETIAGGYDFQNRFLSCWIDTWWRRKMVQCLRADASGLVLDVATGTAEIAIQIARKRKRLRVVGIDFSPRMVAFGANKVRRKRQGDRISFVLGDARCLPFRGSEFEALTIAFGIRNMNERERILHEFYTMLRRGGQLIIMEFGVPEAPVIGGLYRFYFDKILPRVGDFISGTGYAYTYLSRSVHDFPSREEFVGMIEAAGFREVQVKPLTLGIALLFTATKG